MGQGNLIYALFFEVKTWTLANIHRTKVITPPSPLILLDIQEDNYDHKLKKEKHFYSV